LVWNPPQRAGSAAGVVSKTGRQAVVAMLGPGGLGIELRRLHCRRFAKSGSADDCIDALQGRWARAPSRTRPGSVRREYVTNRFYLRNRYSVLNRTASLPKQFLRLQQVRSHRRRWICSQRAWMISWKPLGDEPRCRHAEKPTAQPSRLCSEAE